MSFLCGCFRRETSPERVPLVDSKKGNSFLEGRFEAPKIESRDLIALMQLWQKESCTLQIYNTQDSTEWVQTQTLFYRSMEQRNAGQETLYIGDTQTKNPDQKDKRPFCDLRLTRSYEKLPKKKGDHQSVETKVTFKAQCSLKFYETGTESSVTSPNMSLTFSQKIKDQNLKKLNFTIHNQPHLIFSLVFPPIKNPSAPILSEGSRKIGPFSFKRKSSKVEPLRNSEEKQGEESIESQKITQVGVQSLFERISSSCLEQ